MKLRINRELHDRARRCADAIGEPLSEFVRLAVLNHDKGRLASVAPETKLQSATRESAVITIGEIAHEPTIIREAIARAVAYAEPLIPPPFQTKMLEGKDYIVEREMS